MLLSTHLVVLAVNDALQKAKGSVVSNRIGMKFGRIVHDQSDFRFNVTHSKSRRRPRRHFTQKSAAVC